MNNNLNNLQAKAQELINELAICIDNADMSQNFLQLQEQINSLFHVIENIEKQNCEIIAQNNEILRQIGNLSVCNNEVMTKKTEMSFDENNIKKESTEIKKESTEIKKEFTEVSDYSNQVQQTENQKLSEVEIQQEKTLESEIQTVEEANEEEQITKEETKVLTTEEEKPKTSSVLEFFHKRVAKDHIDDNNPIEEQPIIPQQKEENTQASSIRDLTNQIKAEAKQQSERKNRSIAEQFEEKTNKDLFSAIGVSEKFMFINDLFSGNVKEYTSFVNDLNEATTSEKATAIITAMQSKKKWPKTSLAMTTLESIITKRFE